ncbi:RF-1 domain containing protein, putative [Trypanosoma equiperdum]|uniref:RF-1 domain containing protein, putative n=1 Tax=Trypanosoma equiperdum TaxID=5694 RepID=A0A1G4I4R6_TRYEQ|nr:RF-1 domain containing protein, putative [Trypanosoma equiperdum]
MRPRCGYANAVVTFSSLPCLLTTFCFGAETCGAFTAAIVCPQRWCAALGERRLSRRRYSAANTKGRCKHVYNIINSLKLVPKAVLASEFDKLHPRDKLDVKRALVRRRGRRSSCLPVFKSALFNRKYFFREADLTEDSTLGRGPGGQATNRRKQTAIVKHVPTGITVKFSKFPSYWLNRRAARDVLNLQLEERMLGSKSELGRIRDLRERRRLWRLRTTCKLVERASKIAAKRSQRHEFHSVLTNQQPLSRVAVLQLDLDQSKQPMYLSDLFDRECGQWWPLLSKAFVRINAESSNEKSAKVPDILFYTFPSVRRHGESVTSVEQYEMNQVKKCAADEVCLANVKRALKCFVELFGLRLYEKPTTTAKNCSVLVLGRDGLNWMEFRGRMVDSSGLMTPLALACFAHVTLSLAQLRCAREVNAIRSFFRREAKAGVPGKWAVQGQEGITEVLRCCELHEEHHPTGVDGVV